MRTNVWWNLEGRIGEASFRTRERAEDFIRRLEAHGGVAVILVEPSEAFTCLYNSVNWGGQ